MQSVVARILHLIACTSFKEWAENVKERRTMARKARTKITRCINRLSAICLVAWHEYSVNQIWERELIRRIVSRLTHKYTLLILERWSENMYELRLQRALMQRIVARIIQQSVYAAFERWAESVGEL